ncbi:hypothetical protein [Paenibacillus planticolens]|uniref:Anticodon-binding domain-containing protein n=1 Tax=Paenibacillus planticolens TaxID=2654976 RepID=A0ABX1ZIS1_9BACL|nr:hypothetical protein [Paenibacillus planticolens]NOU98954.1 hypothetical protein [Paenibacillus planticolens]
MGNANRWYEITDENNQNVNQLKQVRVILLAPKDSRKSIHLISELDQVGIGVRTESVNPKSGIQMAEDLGIRFVVGIHDDEMAADRVSFMDRLEPHERIMSLDQAIYLIEKVYPPADFK